jgi:hypothetical protein
VEVACYVYHYGYDLDLEWSLLSLMMACLRGSYMLCMVLMVSSVLQPVEYLHSMSCRHLLPWSFVFW